MQRFVSGSRAAWDDLTLRSQRACVVFNDCALPIGCRPAHARIGFEARPSEVVLLVDRGVSYEGSSSTVRAWLSAGELKFGRMEDIRNWMRDEIAQLLPVSAPSPALPAFHLPAIPSDLTDLDSVTATTAQHARARLDTDDLLRELRTRVYGQDSALQVLSRRVSQHVRRSRPLRPATLFALGPTGVGKTRAAAALAESLGSVLDGRWSSFVRLNMNEYQESHRVSQLLGAPPSYIGYGDGTHLIDSLTAQPESVVLFDEIEKAHKDILLALMSAMDAGELSSSAPSARGRAVDCRRSVFFFTSNIDVTEVVTEIDASAIPAEQVDTVCRRRLAATGMRPELIGRISAFLVFRPLSSRARAEIATAAITRVAAEYGLTIVHIDPAVVSGIVSRPYSELGARPDEYYVDDMLGIAFARYAESGSHPFVSLEANPDPVCVPALTAGK
jgi:AAA domain (Cdc48 subfamily)